MTDRITFSGRMAHLVTRRFPGLVKAVTHRQARAYERSGGKRGAAMGGKPTFRLTVRGRTSGEPRTVMLMLVRRGADLIVVGSRAGSPDHPNWWKNLMAAGEAQVQVGAESWPVTARELTDPTERSEAWTLACAAYPDFATYQQLTERTIPLAVLTRAG